jgi:hypothetical protein
VIIDACLDEIYSGNGIFEHVKENGGEEYVQKQIAHALNEVPAAKSGQKLVIHCKKGDRHNINDRTQKALIAAKCPVFYYRGGVLVEPIWRWEKTGEDNHETLATSLVKLNPARLSYMTGKHAAIFQKYNVRDKRWEAIDPPKEMIEQLLDLGHWGFDTIKGIINSPTMRPDGSLLTVPGYDKATQLWYKSSGDIELPDIPERPTKEDALAALELLTKLLAGFLFKDDAGISLAVAIAGLMTPVLRGRLRVCATVPDSRARTWLRQELPSPVNRDARYRTLAGAGADEREQGRTGKTAECCSLRREADMAF